jgi:hypothetical protein
LPLEALPENHAQPARLAFLDHFHLRAPADDAETAQKLFAIRRGERLVDGDFVFLVDLVARVREREREVAVIGHQEQSFAFQIEPADVKNARPMRREQFEDRAAILFIIRAHDEAARLEERGVNRRLRMHHLAADLYHVVRFHLRGQVFDEMSVDADFSIADQGLDPPAGAQAGGGKKSV